MSLLYLDYAAVKVRKRLYVTRFDHEIMQRNGLRR